MSGFSFKIIDRKGIDWEKIESCYDHTVFKSQKWINFLIDTQNVEPFVVEIIQKDKLIGFFIGEKFKKIFTIVSSPFEGWSTSFQGLNMLNPISIKMRVGIYEELIKYLFDQKICSFFQSSDWQLDLAHVAHSGLKFEILKGYYLDLSKSEKEIFDNMSSSAKDPIRKAKKNNITVKIPKETSSYLDVYYAQLLDVFGKQGLKPTHNLKDISLMVNTMVQSNKILMMESVSTEGIGMASGFFLYDNDFAFYAGGASFQRFQKLCPNEILIFEALKGLKELGVRTVEFGGGRRYKEKYGTTPYVKPRIVASRYPSLYVLKSVSKRFYYELRNSISVVKRYFVK